MECWKGQDKTGMMPVLFLQSFIICMIFIVLKDTGQNFIPTRGQDADAAWTPTTTSRSG